MIPPAIDRYSTSMTSVVDLGGMPVTNFVVVSSDSNTAQTVIWSNETAELALLPRWC